MLFVLLTFLDAQQNHPAWGDCPYVPAASDSESILAHALEGHVYRMERFLPRHEHPQGMLQLGAWVGLPQIKCLFAAMYSLGSIV